MSQGFQELAKNLPRPAKGTLFLGAVEWTRLAPACSASLRFARHLLGLHVLGSAAAATAGHLLVAEPLGLPARLQTDEMFRQTSDRFFLCFGVCCVFSFALELGFLVRCPEKISEGDFLESQRSKETSLDHFINKK